MDVPLSHVLIALYRMRCGSDGQVHRDKADDPLFGLILRFSHVFGQAAEEGIAASTTAECPDPTVRERMHPFMQTSRRKGNPALKIHTINQFQARGGGFVSTKDEVALHKLNIVSKTSPFANRTGSEFAARTLQKSSEFLQKYLANTDMKVLNFVLDAATVSGEHVTHLVWKRGSKVFVS